MLQAVPLCLSWQGVGDALWLLPFTKKEESGSSLTAGRQEGACCHPNIHFPGYAWGRPSSSPPRYVPQFPYFTLHLALYIFN